MKRFLTLLLLSFAGHAVAADGDFDAGFGTGGVIGPGFALPTPSDHSMARRVEALADGRIVVMSVAYISGRFRAVVSRLQADGALDGTFGDAGRAILSAGGESFVPYDMKLGGDGRILVAGVLDGNFLAVTRLTASGLPDMEFGSSGTVAVEPGYPVRRPKLAIQPDGKVVVFTTRFGGGNFTELLLLRFDEMGAPDPGFGTEGIAYTGLAAPNNEPQALALQADGSIVAVYTRHAASVPVDATFSKVLLRFTTAGALDGTFNGGAGELVLPLPADLLDSDVALAVLADGTMLVAGYAKTAKAQGVARILATGALDTTFGSGGVAFAPPGEIPDVPNAIAVLPDGRFLTAGSAKYGVGSNYALASIARFLPNGRLDPNFRGTGRHYQGALFNNLLGIARQPDGKVVLAGWLYADGHEEAKVSRLEGPAASQAVAGSSAVAVLSGESVDLTADIYGASPTGTVDFRVGGVDIPGCTGIALVGSAASCPGQVFPPGANAITVAYSGDADDPPAVSPAWSQFVLTAGDLDGDGVPDVVEMAEFLNPAVKDNDLFASTPKGARLFAMQQYRDFLGREGEEAGLAQWHHAMMSGWTRGQVIDAFLAAPEYAGFVPPVIRLYFATFQRVPDYAGLTANVGLLRSAALTPVQLADAFAGSPEFVSLYGALDDTQFVTQLYGNVLGRAPDPAGLAGWVALLGGGYTRGQVLLGFSESPEYRSATADETFVTALYAGMLRRAPEPAGFSAWLELLRSVPAKRALVADGIYRSGEYRARFLP